MAGAVVLRGEFVRRRRLVEGRCPTHGLALAQVGVAYSAEGDAIGDRVGCPRGDCGFETTVEPGSKLWKALHL